MKTTLTLVAAFAVASFSYAQKVKDRPEFGVITPEEISMKNYAPDTAATAVVLFDIGSVVLKRRPFGKIQETRPDQILWYRRDR